MQAKAKQSKARSKNMHYKARKRMARQTWRRNAKDKHSEAMQSTSNQIQSDALEQCRTRRSSQAIFYTADS
jgi:hypothetical protein